jgi:ABC-2 type transport system permease protein
VERTAAVMRLHRPGHSRGLLDIPHWSFLLKLLVRKELRVRYRGSLLGMIWTYVKPAVQLIVYFLAMGKFFSMNDRVTNYIVYLFAGIVVVNVFNEVMRNTTASIVSNAPLVGKIYLPRELFPMASLWVAFVHFFPQVAVLLVATIFFGWRPGLLNIGAFLLGILLVATLALGLGLMFAAWNVIFRDAENIVELISMVAIWFSPVFYNADMVARALPDWLFFIYQCNPLTCAVELFHYAFWAPTTAVTSNPDLLGLPVGFGTFLAVAFALSLALLALGQLVFRRHEARFAEEL